MKKMEKKDKLNEIIDICDVCGKVIEDNEESNFLCEIHLEDFKKDLFWR